MKPDFKDQIRKWQLTPNATIMQQIASEWQLFTTQLESLKQIDVTNVVPMTRVDNQPLTYLRPDEPRITLDREHFLQNAPSHQTHLVKINAGGRDD